MSKIDYKAMCLKQAVMAVMPSKESKYQSEATKMVMAIIEQEKKEYLHIETVQPTYQLAIVQQLQPDSSKAAGEELVCVTDNKRAVRVTTDTLRAALYSWGDHVVTMELMQGGAIELRTSSQSKMTVDAVLTAVPQVPARLEEGTVLSSFKPLYEGLRAAVETAGVVGNESEKCCVHLHLTPEALIVEGCNPRTVCAYEAREVYDRAPEQCIDMALSVDCAKRLYQLLLTQECTEVRMCETQNGNLVVQAGQFTMVISKQRITFPDLCEQRDRTYTRSMPVRRKEMLQAVRTLKAMHEAEASVMLSYEEMTLTGTDNRLGEATLTVPVYDGKLPQGIPGNYTRHMGRLPIVPLITALSICTGEDEALVQWDEGEGGMIVDCGNLRMVVR